MMRRSSCFLLHYYLHFLSYAQKKDKKLQREIKEAISGFNGKVGSLLHQSKE